MRLLTIITLLFANSLYAQIGTGEWRLHTPSTSAHSVAYTSENIYTAYVNGVSEYNIEYNETSLWNGVNGLSDISVSTLGTCLNDDAVFIGYENGNIDKIKDNTLTNIPAIVLAEMQGSRKIYSIIEYGDYMYFATGFGIVKIDPIKNEVRDTYYPTGGNDPIIDIVFHEDSIYALAEDRLFRGLISASFALADPNNWDLDSRVPILVSEDEFYQDIEVAFDDIYIALDVDGYANDSLYSLQSTTLLKETFAGSSIEIECLSFLNDQFIVSHAFGGALYASDLSQTTFLDYTFGGAQSKHLVFKNDSYWIADGYFGLVKFNTPWSNANYGISGPPKNKYYGLDWQSDKLAVVSGGISGVATTFNNGGMYTFENEEWNLFDRSTVPEWNGANIWDFVGVSINPREKEQLAVGTYSQYSLSVFNENGTVDTFSVDNSILEKNASFQWSLVSDVQYDIRGNLWILNGYANQPLKVLTPEGEWYGMETGSSSMNKFSRRLVIDYNENKWFGERHAGLFGFNDNGTIEDPSDDKYVYLTVGENSGNIPTDDVTAIAVDFDNEIWIGTEDGFAVLYNSDQAFDASFGEYNAQRIKLEFEGNVEYMLGSTHITDIEVDGGNRKWFGTASSGIILLSPDGQEILEQHTVENSPLISNNIIDLELDQNTGELFIVTDLGLVSYRTDATYENSDYSSVDVFPNPVRPGFNGLITIQGIQYDSDVKFTDAAGNLDYKTTSNGGTATWDGYTLTGERVESGVYLIWTAPNAGKGRFVGKVVVIN